MLEQGATLFRESWSGQSRIHNTLISIGSWSIQGLGGIRLDEQSSGFPHFILKPARSSSAPKTPGRLTNGAPAATSSLLNL